MKTKVLFLYNKKNDDLFAFFPEEYYNKEHLGERFLTCYAHIGQHSACNSDYAKECKEATKEEYNDLKEELESIGYELEILNEK